MKQCHFRLSILSVALITACQVSAMELASDHQEPVMVVSAPPTSPLTVVASPKSSLQSASDASDHLKTLPGFSQIRNGGTNGDPVLRGMFGSRLRILTDGGEILGACPGRMDAPSSYISPESFDLMNIVKGPQTVLWGPGNSAGTIRFDRAPSHFEQATLKGDASLLTASNSRWDENANFTMGNEDGYLRLMGNKSRAGDYKDGDGSRVPSRWDKWNADMALGWTPDKDTLLELTAGTGDGEASYAGRAMDGAQFKRQSLGASFEKSNIGEVFDKFEAKIHYNYANHVMDNHSLRDPQSMMQGMSPVPEKTAQRDTRSVNGRMMGTWLWSDFELQSGMDMQTSSYRKYDVSHWAQDARFHNIGVFSELSWTMDDSRKLITGARLDRTWVDNSTSSGQAKRNDTMPAGFVRLEQTLETLPVMLYAGVGYTERFPDFWELFSKTTYTDGRSSAFDAVAPEKTTQLDIGAKYSGDRLDGWISAYLGRVSDFVLFNYDDANGGAKQVGNVDAAIMGGETGLNYKLTENLNADASLAYSWGQNRSDKRPLPQMPPLESRLGLTWHEGSWSTSGLLRMVSHQHRVAMNEGNVVGKDFDRSNGFAILSANAAYAFTADVKVSTGVDNIFNRTYSEHLNLAGNSAFGYSGATPVNEPGRTWWAKLNVKF
ncbi:TonB-dependent copper receptor [Erwinia amylovora]|uniref:TonB-dependent copper receptor n=2 Tax=Erwinia amylovora TaxID=552 RepID=UPI000C084774|nr:TonB-dependent copper receptor [Erwinia amylovora]UDJ88349.1 TonB-dependent copper receptor [Erwinia amylovora]UDJ99807.1 TonB-dependent copper receptor [Erwinia amylovora]UDK88135.1 TonB-dependent copper receptor [Erwinia amylovora]UDK91531.1 TonB-dependent copper receptor [Erwinia amylovora]UOD75541.1 TonB-dependent copper receptor [Erwinia amylovora]